MELTTQLPLNLRQLKIQEQDLSGLIYQQSTLFGSYKDD